MSSPHPMEQDEHPIQDRRPASRRLLEEMCAIAAGQPPPHSDTAESITPQDAIALLHSLLPPHALAAGVRRTRLDKSQYEIYRPPRYAKYFEVLGHNGVVDRLCFDNSSRFAFSGSTDGIIKIWNIEEGMLVHSLRGHPASINDICVSPSGRYLVSADIQGCVNVWCLRTLSLLHTFDMQNEVIFCEFFTCPRPGKKHEEPSHAFSCVLSTGVVKIMRFSESSVLSAEENVFMQGESIKAICVTDGARFIICGGWWPFVLVYDTWDIHNVIILEDVCAQTLCAGINGLKIAAATEQAICIYTFYSEGSPSQGNFKRRRGGRGYWRRLEIGLGTENPVERMVFLPSALLVSLSTDGLIRIFDDDKPVLQHQAEAGYIYAHRTRNIFVIVGVYLTFYCVESGPWESGLPAPPHWQSGPAAATGAPVVVLRNSAGGAARLKQVYRELLPVGLNDCHFSPDGEFFITSDDRGVITAYSVREPVRVPAQQFLASDLVATPNMVQRRINRQEVVIEEESESSGSAEARSEDEIVAGLDELARWTAGAGLEQCRPPESATEEQVVDATNTPCRRWKRTAYEITPVPGTQRILEIEAAAAKYLEREKMGFTAFARRYLSAQASTTATADESDEESEESEGDSSDVTWHSSEEEEAENSSSSPSVVSEDEEEEDFPRLRRRVAGGSSPSRSHPPSPQARRAGRFIVEGESSEELPRKRRAAESPRGRRSQSPTREAARPTRRTSVAAQGTPRRGRGPRRIMSSEESDPVRGGPPSRDDSLIQVIRHTAMRQQHDIEPHFEAELAAHARSWLSSFALFPGDEVYLDARAYREFLSLEPRLGPVDRPKSGSYTVTRVEICFIGQIPYLSLLLNGSARVKFYEYPDGTGMLCLREQRGVSGRVRVLLDGAPVEETVVEERGLSIFLRGQEARRIYRSSIIIERPPLRWGPVEYQPQYRALFGRMRTRRAGASLLDVLNYDVVNARLANRLYRNKKQLVEDAKAIEEEAGRLGEQHAEFAKSVTRGFR